MSRLTHRIAAATMALLLLFAMQAPAAAASNSTEYAYNGSGSAWTVNPLTVYGDDLFGQTMKELMPGDVKTIYVELQNNSSNQTTFYMKAEAVSLDKAAAIITANPGLYSGKTENAGLLDLINIEISYNSSVIYDGPLSGDGTGIYASSADTELGRVLLGTVASSSSGTIQATISVPETVSNEYMDTLTAVNWTFYTIQDTTPTTTTTPYSPGTSPAASPGVSTSPSPNTDTSPSPSGETGEEDDGLIPLAITSPAVGGGQDNEVIEEDDRETPLTKPDVVIVQEDPDGLPLTGGITLYVVPLVLLLAALIVVFLLVNKRRGAAR